MAWTAGPCEHCGAHKDNMLGMCVQCYRYPINGMPPVVPWRPESIRASLHTHPPMSRFVDLAADPEIEEAAALTRDDLVEVWENAKPSLWERFKARLRRP